MVCQNPPKDVFFAWGETKDSTMQHSQFACLLDEPIRRDHETFTDGWRTSLFCLLCVRALTQKKIEEVAKHTETD